MARVILDAGHGHNTPGKRTPDGIREWDLNNGVANYATNILRAHGVEVIRTDDVTGAKDISLFSRQLKTNRTNPDCFVSIHHNALRGVWGGATGVEVHVHPQGSQSDNKLANLILPKLVGYTGLSNRGLKRSNFAVLRCKSSIPAVLVEGGFMDGNKDSHYIRTEQGKEAYGRSVAEGVLEFLGINKHEVAPQAKPQEAPQVQVEQNNGYKVRITTDVLRVRSIPSTSGAITDRVRKGEIYTIIEEQNGWGRLKSGAGWISLAYTTRDLNASTPTPAPQKTQVQPKYPVGRYQTTARLNVRAGSGIGYRVLKTYGKGIVFDVKRVVGNWGQTPSGWVCLDYARLLFRR